MRHRSLDSTQVTQRCHLLPLLLCHRVSPLRSARLTLTTLSLSSTLLRHVTHTNSRSLFPVWFPTSVSVALRLRPARDLSRETGQGKSETVVPHWFFRRADFCVLQNKSHSFFSARDSMLELLSSSRLEARLSASPKRKQLPASDCFPLRAHNCGPFPFVGWVSWTSGSVSSARDGRACGGKETKWG